MCDPIYAGAAILASSGMQAYSQYQSGKFNADVANKMHARTSRQRMFNQSLTLRQKQRSRTRQLAGSQAAAMSASV